MRGQNGSRSARRIKMNLKIHELPTDLSQVWDIYFLPCPSQLFESTSQTSFSIQYLRLYLIPPSSLDFELLETWHPSQDCFLLRVQTFERIFAGAERRMPWLFSAVLIHRASHEETAQLSDLRAARTEPSRLSHSCRTTATQWRSCPVSEEQRHPLLFQLPQLLGFVSWVC